MKARLSGNVKIVIKKKKKSIEVNQHNNVSSDLAQTLASLLFFGLPSSSYSSFSIPSGIAIVLLNNGAVVNTLTATVTKFSDVVNGTTETTSITYVASDGTTAQYTFDSAELYTVVNGQLYLKIADVQLSSPLTKEEDDILAITWVETLETQGGLGNEIAYAQSLCSSPQGSCTSSQVNASECNSNASSISPTQASAINMMWVLLVYPNPQSLSNNSQYPVSYWLNIYFNTSASAHSYLIPQGIKQVILRDCNLDVGQVISPTPTVTQTVNENSIVIAVYSFTVSTTTPYPYVQVFVSFQSDGYGMLVPIFLVPLQNQNQASTGLLTLSLEVPYGPSTLQQLVINQ